MNNSPTTRSEKKQTSEQTRRERDREEEKKINIYQK